ncbi:unnamed protein product [Rhizophagus irregularis]|nr:unnamed protein product [Rhizophagus irregularis]
MFSLDINYKNLQENEDLKQRILNQEKQKTNLLGENERLKRQCKNFQGENQNLKQKLNNKLEENEKLKQQYKNLQDKFNEIDSLGKLELDELNELNEVNENDIKNSKEKNKTTTFPLIDDDIKDKEFIQHIEDPSGSVPFPSEDKSNRSENVNSGGSSNERDNIKVVIGLDFRATYSGFSYCHTAEPKNIITINQWPDIKTNTVLQYDSKFINVETEIRELIEATIAQRCEIAIIRNCVFNAGLIEEKCSKNLQFTTEPEAVAINCLKYMGKDDIGLNFMVVNCGGVTVDLTTRKLLENNKMSEVYERSGDLCGSTFIDQKFIKFLHRKLGRNAIGLLRENYYDQFQYMIQDFCRNVKLLFTGDPSEYRLYELEIEETVPVLLQYIKGKDKEDIEENEWVVDIEYKDIKAMFDPIVDRIIKLIHSQLSNARKECSVMFLVGSFR